MPNKVVHAVKFTVKNDNTETLLFDEKKCSLDTVNASPYQDPNGQMISSAQVPRSKKYKKIYLGPLSVQG